MLRIISLFTLLLCVASVQTFAQSKRALPRTDQLSMGGGDYVLFGDLIVDETKAVGATPPTYEILLNNLGGTAAARQYVSSGGRYQFMNLAAGQYELVVLLDQQEMTRTRVEILPGPPQERIRQDIRFAVSTVRTAAKPATVSATDYYKRSENNEKLFVKAKEAGDQKRYEDSIVTLKQLVEADPHDFLAWAELGTAYLFTQKYDESESAYVKSVTERPTFFLGQMNLGRLRSLKKNFEGAIEPLTAAVNIQPTSADANYLLGEAYLQIKKGSKAVGYINEAIRLDPVGKADGHLRLATLYNAVGMKDKAAIEYEEFLKKKPNYPDSKKLRDYIAANKK